MCSADSKGDTASSEAGENTPSHLQKNNNLSRDLKHARRREKVSNLLQSLHLETSTFYKKKDTAPAWNPLRHYFPRPTSQPR